MPTWFTTTGFFSWLATLDWTAIVSTVAPTFITGLVVWWMGGFRYLIRRFKQSRSLRKYKGELKRDVGSLAVIGRREGFDLAKVYVRMDIARSDLMNKATDSDEVPRTFVLVGGPGAGKSTYVKKLLIDELNTSVRTPYLYPTQRICWRPNQEPSYQKIAGYRNT